MVKAIEVCLIIIAAAFYGVNAACPNHCNGHGTCDKFARFEAWL